MAADIHDRMPVLLNPDQYETWLNPTLHAMQAFEMLKPYRGADFRVQRVRTRADDQLSLV